MLKVVDRFTTQHGSWDINPNKPYGIDQAHRDKYEAGRLIPGSGGDHHIFVYAPFALFVRFSSDGETWYTGAFKDGWWNFPMFKDAFYDPDANETGPWRVRTDNEEIANGIGLPKGEHVSTFLIVEDVDEGSQPEPPTENADDLAALKEAIAQMVSVWEKWLDGLDESTRAIVDEIIEKGKRLP